MFEKVLIANRGEIAVRIIRACKALGIHSVAVHSAADSASLHVRLADESVNLGDGPAGENYLNVSAILDAAIQTGAEAVHPGYGFLAENASFAAAVEQAGITFIGPSSSAIQTMGEKVAAREVAIAAEVPLAPGSDGPVHSAEQVVAFGAEHGYPVLIKASFGGGGRGMRKVNGPEEVAEAYAAASREATAAFGNGEVYCERYLENARHIEVQVFADNHGNAVYLGDRDCSVQRRYQKLIEEAPAPGLSDETRAAMGGAAVRLAREVNYSGAGTVEFLYEGGKFYFLEMNTRIQVEHPVTEEVTGIDIVETQLRVASGQPLPFAQQDISTSGAAIEARINAEDPSGGLFLPSPGLIESVAAPQGDGLRWDAGYESGDEVLPLYDSLIGKLIAKAPSRAEAIEKLRAALHELRIEGVRSTAPAAAHILSEPAFERMDISTLWLERSVEFPDFEDQEPSRSEVEVGGRYYTIPFFPEGAIGQAGAWNNADARFAGGAGGSAEPGGGNAASSGRGRGSAKSGRSRKKPNDGTVKTPMQGTIVKINVNAGDEVTAGTTLFVLEAMKMENPIQAQQDGVIAEVHAVLGEAMPAGSVLAVFEGAVS